MNGAWRANLDESLWTEQPKRKQNKSRILNDLVLKPLEVIEANELLGREPIEANELSEKEPNAT